ncbi:DUF4974 domain-containing protein [Pseudoflavitalea sp. G-6-1-2]|uniref:FecR family protein n=1 Tax=Pseudoflavitalea sp. G-6-1-2 TaxID=2728841 RepID=UPI00146C9E4C|nr:FecR family protein [Pseudoflavitalea sp. G-6-1-2]NML23891.1 DUF4974 domain-containing protein [Pseudoflavitalea sp. G-6-1-2]
MNYSDLLPKFAAGTATEEEREAFNDWLCTLTPDAFREVLAAYENALTAQTTFAPHNQQLLQSILHNIEAQQQQTPVRRLFGSKLFRYAAAIVLIGCAGTFWLLRNDQRQPLAEKEQTPSGRSPNDIPPGKEGAILTLADGRTIVLDSLQPGAIAHEGNNQIILKDGQLDYLHGQKTGTSAAVLYNTMQTPHGRQFQLTLPDGTRVWLNALSSIRFPVAFADTREVNITGEAYLEVAKDPRKKFVVHSNGISTEVLGTHFNVNAYEDEDAVRITLIEGKVQVRNNKEAAALNPGMQAKAKQAAPIGITPVNTDQAIAWKNGVFNLQDCSLHTVMRQIARWYDVEIVYEKNVPELTFQGKMQRNLSLTQLLKGLQDQEVKFRIDGKKLIVSP